MSFYFSLFSKPTLLQTLATLSLFKIQPSMNAFFSLFSKTPLSTDSYLTLSHYPRPIHDPAFDEHLLLFFVQVPSYETFLLSLFNVE